MTTAHSFRSVYERHVRMVFNLCLNYLQHPVEAEEVTQDVFVKVHEGLVGFRAEAALRTWIYRITVNSCLDHIKSRNRKKRSWLGPLKDHTDEAEKVQATPFDHPGVQLEHREATEHIFRLINALPAQQRTALLLKTMEGLSQSEVGEVMGVSPKAVESLLSRARRKLKQDLGTSAG